MSHAATRHVSMRPHRIAVATIFFLDGAGFANWVVRIPAVQARFGLSAGALGLVLLALAVGALVAMPLAGGLAARRGSGPVTRAAALAFAGTLALPPLAPNVASLTLALVALGAANGALGVAMNAQASEIERRYARPIMSSFHALFSAGGLAGASLGGLAAGRGIGLVPHLVGAALAVGLVALAASAYLLPTETHSGRRAPLFAWPTRSLLAVGLVAFCVLFGEGAMADWTAVYVRDVTGAGPGLAAVGFAAYSLTMAAGRFMGDALVARTGAVRLVRAGGTLAALGVAFALAVAEPWAAAVGFGAVGAGLSNVFPTVLAAAGRTPGVATGTAIAAVSSLGYAGFLTGPPIIGIVAHSFTLRVGLVAVAVAGLCIVGAAGALRTLPASHADASRDSEGLERSSEDAARSADFGGAQAGAQTRWSSEQPRPACAATD